MLRRRILQPLLAEWAGPGLGATLPSQSVRIVGGSLNTSRCRTTFYCNLNSLHLGTTRGDLVYLTEANDPLQTTVHAQVVMSEKCIYVGST